MELYVKYTLKISIRPNEFESGCRVEIAVFIFASATVALHGTLMNKKTMISVSVVKHCLKIFYLKRKFIFESFLLIGTIVGFVLCWPCIRLEKVKKNEKKT